MSHNLLEIFSNHFIFFSFNKFDTDLRNFKIFGGSGLFGRMEFYCFFHFNLNIQFLLFRLSHFVELGINKGFGSLKNQWCKIGKLINKRLR